MSDATPNTDAERELGAFDATMLVMGGIVGIGIFFTPGQVAGILPDPTVFLGAWVLGGLVAMCGALTFADLGANLPAAGGWFVYLHRAFGPLPAFLFAWTILGVVSSGAIATIASFCASQFGGLLPFIGASGSVSHLVAAVAIVVGLTALALGGIRLGVTVQSAVMVLKLTAILALAAGGIALGLFDADAFAASADAAATESARVPARGLAAGLAAAALPIFYSYGGWQNLCYAADRVRDPRRTLARVIPLGVGATVAVYVAVNLGFLAVYGTEGLSSEPDFAAGLAEALVGPGGRVALQAAMAVSALGVCMVTILLTPGIYVAIAREGLFFAGYGKLHGPRRVPVLALTTQGAIALAYLAWSEAEAWSGAAPSEGGMDFEMLTRSVVFAEWIFHAGVAAALLRLRSALPGYEPLGGAVGRLAPVVYLLAALGVVVGNLLSSDGLETRVGLVTVAAGAVAYVLWRAARGGGAQT